jgi:hypothetical protein
MIYQTRANTFGVVHARDAGLIYTGAGVLYYAASAGTGVLYDSTSAGGAQLIRFPAKVDGTLSRPRTWAHWPHGIPFTIGLFMTGGTICNVVFSPRGPGVFDVP